MAVRAYVCALAVAVTCFGCKGVVNDSAQDADAPVADGGQDLGAPSQDAGAPQPGKLFEMLDDMERGEANLATPIGLGSWMVQPADSNPTPAVERMWLAPAVPRDGSVLAQAVRVDAPGTIDLRIDLHGPQFGSGGPPFPDVSAYAGVAFWVRGLSPTDAMTVAIEADPVTPGRAYEPARTSADPWFEHPVKLSSEWRRHILLFDDFRQPDHPDARVRTQALWSVHFIGGLDRAGAEFWIDDMALLCKGTCPAPAWDLYPTAGPGMSDSSLPWVAGSGSTADTTCATIAPLSLASLSNVSADPVEKVLLRVRIPADPQAAVPLWDWVVEDIASGAKLDFAAIDDVWSTVAVPITAAGRYRVAAHTHYPNLAVCGIETQVDAH